MKRILVVNAGSSKKWFVFDLLRDHGFEIAVINREKLDLPAVSDWVIADTFDHQASVRAAEDFNAVKRIDGVVTYWEDDVLLTAKIADSLKLKGISYPRAQKARNKFLFREFCREHNLPFPKYKLIKSKNDIAEVTRELSFPLVIKPIYGSSSAFVTKVEDEKELTRTYNFISRNISTQAESALHEGVQILAEEYIDGDEVDVDVLLQNGKIKFFSVTDNFKTEEPFFVETGDAVPSLLAEDDQGEILALVDETLEKLEITDGCIHFEAKLTDTGAVPIEVNLRMGGDQTHMYVREVWGVDLAVAAAQIAVGEYIRPEKPEEPAKYVASKYFLADSSGVLANFDVDEELSKDPNVLDFQFFKEVGDSVLVPPEGYEYLGWLTVMGSNPNDADDNLHKLYELVDYSIVEFEGGSEVSRRLAPKGNYSKVELKRRLLTNSSRINHLKRKFSEEAQVKIGLADNFYQEEPSENAKKVATILTDLGYEVINYNLDNINEIFRRGKTEHADIALALTNEINDTTILSQHIPALFDILGIPFIGSNTRTVALAKDAIKTRKILDYHNVPLPSWDYVYNISDTIKSELEFPVVLRAGFLRSHKLPKGVIVNDLDKLQARIEELFENHGAPVLAEEHIAGNTIYINLIGNYPQVEVANISFGENKDYDEKLLRLLKEMAVDVYNLLDCSDYATVKLVVDERNNPYFISIDTNPLINMPAALITQDYLEAILKSAISRVISEHNYSYLLPNSI